MTHNSRVKNHNDTEKAYDTIINSTEFIFNTRNKIGINGDIKAMAQQLNTESFDTYLEKKK
jgi:hypothetical protein